MEIIFVLKNRRENGDRLESDRDSNSSSFSPFLVLRLLMVSVTIIGVACGGGYSGEGAAVVALGECGEDLLLPIIKWMCFACMIFEKL